MRKLIFTFLFLALSTQTNSHSLVDTPSQVIRVGVWKNPPVVLQDQKGNWRGIAIDVLKTIAVQQGWTLEFVPGTFAQQLKNLQQHRIDLLVSIAYSDKRALQYTYNRTPLLSNWGVVYARADANINSLLSLEDKRIAVMRNNIHDKAFRGLVKNFSLKPSFIEYDNFSDVMKNIDAGIVDAGVANRLFGALNAEKYHLVETGIIFNPINLHYAAPHATHKPILDVIDKHLLIMKADKNSIYYGALRQWMNIGSHNALPNWVPWLASGLFSAVLLMMVLTVLLRRQVARRTRELQVEVDERRIAQERLDRLAYYDVLTGLPNRVSFSENLKLAIATARRRNAKIAVMFIDLDQFKTINDSLGHDAGDQLIMHVAQRLKVCLRDEDTLNRFGGDEFVAILQDVSELGGIGQVAERMLNCLRAPINIGVSEIYTSISIGIALYPADDLTVDGLLKNADAAMYHAKAQGGNNYQFYNSELTQRVRNRLDLETRLRHALNRDELRLHYQPIFDLDTRQPVGVEALIRWQDPENGLIAPDNFIPFAEETGLIVPFGEWVLNQACMQLRAWEDQGLGELRLAINISSRQFEHNRLHPTVQSALQNSRISANRLELEITERMFLNITSNVSNTLNKLKSEGVGLSIDDFGTGYSSLSYLKQLPIDTLKIDRSFVSNIPTDKDNMQIVSTIISMSQGLGLKVVAEGIETEEQLKTLNAWGCHCGQGYYMARPQPVDEVTAFLKKHLA